MNTLKVLWFFSIQMQTGLPKKSSLPLATKSPPTLTWNLYYAPKRPLNALRNDITKNEGTTALEEMIKVFRCIWCTHHWGPMNEHWMTLMCGVRVRLERERGTAGKHSWRIRNALTNIPSLRAKKEANLCIKLRRNIMRFHIEQGRPKVKVVPGVNCREREDRSHEGKF